MENIKKTLWIYIVSEISCMISKLDLRNILVKNQFIGKHLIPKRPILLQEYPFSHYNSGLGLFLAIQPKKLP